MPTTAYVQAGYERSTETLTLGVSHDLESRTTDAPASLYLEGQLATPSLHEALDVHAGTVRAGLRVELVRAGRFALPIRAGVAIGIAVDPQVALHIALRTEVAALPGYYGEQGSFALEAGLRSTWGTYEAGLGEDAPQDVWRHVSTQRVRVGARMAVFLSARLLLTFRVGYDDVHDAKDVAPTYADLTAGVRF